MKRMMVSGMLFILLFSASAAGSWFWLQSQAKPEADDETAQVALFPDEDSSDPTVPRKAPSMLVQFRSQDLTAESLLRMAEMLQRREEAVKQNEQELKQQQTRMEFIFQDLQRERTELDALQDKVDARINEAAQLMEQIKSQNQKLDEEKAQVTQQLEKMEKQINADDASELANISKLAEYYKGMPEETAAKYLRQSCDEGEIEMVASVLDSMEKAAATKILVAFDDSVLVDQLIKKIKERPTATSADGGKKKRGR